MKLRQLMSSNVFSLSPRATVNEAAKMMQQHNIGAIPVCEGKKLVGILTDRDIVVRALAEEKDPERVAVSEVMSRELVMGNPEMDVHEAAQLMANEQIRRLPVVEDNSLVGIVALGDLAVEAPYENEAGATLSEVSQPSRPLM